MSKTDATIALLTFNGEEYLEALLTAVFSQRTKLKFEVLMIDSGSTDRTLDIAALFPEVILHKIPNSEFGHGKTRNLAVKMAHGEFVLFLTQDAVPSHDRWLDYMVEPFSVSEEVACVLGKQIPRADCFATLKREVYEVFRSFGADDAIILHRKTIVNEGLTVANTFLSDTNSAVRTSLVSSILPFRDVNYAEDQAMGIDCLDKGYIKAYAPLGSVYHSHDYPLRKYYKRKFDEVIGLKESTGQVMRAGRKELIVGTLKASVHDWVYIIRDKDYGILRKLHDMVLAPAYNFAYRRAIRVASSESLSNATREKLSLEVQSRKATNKS